MGVLKEDHEQSKRHREAGAIQREAETLRRKASDYLFAWKLKDAIPSVAGLARYLDTSKRCVLLWRREDPSFAHRVDVVETEQERLLVNGLVTGEIETNATIAKHLLTEVSSSQRTLPKQADAPSGSRSGQGGASKSVKKKEAPPAQAKVVSLTPDSYRDGMRS